MIVNHLRVYGLRGLSILVCLIIKDIVMYKSSFFKELSAYSNRFNQCYKAMKEYHLENEIQMEIKNGNSFFDACQEWDIY